MFGFVVWIVTVLLGFIMGWLAGRIALRRRMVGSIIQMHAELDKVVAALKQRHDPNAVPPSGPKGTE